MDPQGHVNQAVFLTYFESGRVGMFRNKDLGIGVPGVTFVVGRMEINYMRELRWPATIEVGTGVAEFGRSSFKVAQAIFRDGLCCCHRPRDDGLHGYRHAQINGVARPRRRSPSSVSGRLRAAPDDDRAAVVRDLRPR